jgi:hypothetical protein
LDIYTNKNAISIAQHINPIGIKIPNNDFQSIIGYIYYSNKDHRALNITYIIPILIEIKKCRDIIGIQLKLKSINKIIKGIE